MTGRVLDADGFVVEVDDTALKELYASNGQAWIVDAHKNFTAAEVHHDGERYVLRTRSPIARHVREVEVRLRGVRQREVRK